MAADERLRTVEPVLVNAGISNGVKTLVLAVISLALAFEWVTWTDAQVAAVLGVVAAGFVVLSSVLSIRTRASVTPLANPRDRDGQRLVAEK